MAPETAGRCSVDSRPAAAAAAAAALAPAPADEKLAGTRSAGADVAEAKQEGGECGRRGGGG